MNSRRGCGLLPWLLAAMSLLLFQSGTVLAADSPEQQMSLTINAGESYVIDNVSPGAAPSVSVIDNPHALVVHDEEPGKVVLLGAEAGHWEVRVKLANGTTADYDVQVKALADAYDINHPASSPPAIGDSGKKAAIAAPVVAKMDSGTGPVDSAAPAAAPAKADTDTGKAADSSAAPVASAPAPAPAAADPGAPTPPAPIAQDSAVPTISSQTASAGAPPLRHMAAPDGAYTVNPTIADTGGEYPSDAVSGGTHYLPADAVVLMTGSSRIIDFPAKIKRVSIADTGVADLQVVNPYQINLIGHKPGFTTLAVWNTQGHYDERQVRIDPNGKQQVMLNTMVAELNRTNLENQGANVSAALTKIGVSLVSMPGNVATPYSPTTTLTSSVLGFPVQSSQGATLAPGGALIPMLLSQNMTYGLTAQNSNVETQSMFQYLETHGLAKILAQPHLLANSGEEAKFLSGGEIPIVIAQALNTSIVFKQFGTAVTFVPTVVGRNDIELLVKPEVSEPDPAHGVQLFGFSVPAFITRRAETMVRLRDNQTLIVAGLILHEKKTQVQKVPYLGDIPYVGGLFRNTSYDNSESDLVMSVTPQIVRPLPDGASVYNPYPSPEMTSQQLETRRLAQPDASRPRF
jgi:pilus assembly protein CpaC